MTLLCIKYKGLMDDKLIERLKTENWEEIAPRLIKYAYWKCKYYKWSRNPQNLAKGLQPEDIAMEAINDLLSGKRRWNIDKCPVLLNYLKGVVNSLLSKLLYSWSHKYELPSKKIIASQDDGSHEYDYIADTAENSESSSEELILNTENELAVNEIIKKIFDLASGDDEVGMLLLCMEDGFTKPQEIANELGIDVGQVNNAQKRLRRIASKIKPVYDSMKVEVKQ